MSDRDTGQLIDQLARELRPVRRLRAPWVRALAWLSACAALAVWFGVSDGWRTLSRTVAAAPDEAVELIGATATAIAAALAAFVISVPGRGRRWALLPLPPLLLWAGASFWGCWLSDLAGTGPVAPPASCFCFIVLTSAPLSLLLFVMLRRAFSVHPGLTASMAGLAAAAAAAALLKLEHPLDASVQDLLAHLAGVLAVIGLNRLLTAPALRRLAFALALALPGQPVRAAERRPVVLELFTSQGCSSCPPADRLLTELAARRSDLLALAFHVDYWNRLGWIDPFSAPAFTARQRWHATHVDDPTVYTPELVVDGKSAVIGSDPDAVGAAIATATAHPLTSARVAVARIPAGEVAITVGAGVGQAAVMLLGYDRSHTTAIGRGENGGRTLVESNVVRSLAMVARWDGSPLVLHLPAPAGEVTAVLLEQTDGQIVGAATDGRF